MFVCVEVYNWESKLCCCNVARFTSDIKLGKQLTSMHLWLWCQTREQNGNFISVPPSLISCRYLPLSYFSFSFSYFFLGFLFLISISPSHISSRMFHTSYVNIFICATLPIFICHFHIYLSYLLFSPFIFLLIMFPICHQSPISCFDCKNLLQPPYISDPSAEWKSLVRFPDWW